MKEESRQKRREEKERASYKVKFVDILLLVMEGEKERLPASKTLTLSLYIATVRGGKGKKCFQEEIGNPAPEKEERYYLLLTVLALVSSAVTSAVW